MKGNKKLKAAGLGTAAVCLLVGWLLPSDGAAGIYSRLMYAVALCLAGVFAIGAAVKDSREKSRKILLHVILPAVLGCAVFLMGAWQMKSFVLDIMGGTRTETFSDCEIYHGSGRYIFSNTYMLYGYNENEEKMRFHVSRKMYEMLAEADPDQMEIEYYPNSRVVYSISQNLNN